MRHGSRSAARLIAGAIVLVLHALALWLLWESSGRTDLTEAAPQFVSLWAEPPPPPSLPPPAPSPQRNRPRPPRTQPEPASLVPQPTTQARPAFPPVDWSREAAAVADAHATPPTDPSFGGKPLPQPRAKCKVKEWEWTPEPKKGGVLPLPYVVLGRCVVGLGFFGCSVGEKPETNTHQLDAYKRGENSGPSVPDPNVCD